MRAPVCSSCGAPSSCGDRRRGWGRLGELGLMSTLSACVLPQPAPWTPAPSGSLRVCPWGLNHPLLFQVPSAQPSVAGVPSVHGPGSAHRSFQNQDVGQVRSRCPAVQVAGLLWLGGESCGGWSSGAIQCPSMWTQLLHHGQCHLPPPRQCCVEPSAQLLGKILAAPPGVPSAHRGGGSGRERWLQGRISVQDAVTAKETVVTGVVTLGWVPIRETATQKSEETILGLSAPSPPSPGCSQHVQRHVSTVNRAGAL